MIFNVIGIRLRFLKALFGRKNMANSDRYASILNMVLEVAKKRGLENPGGEVASVCYELVETALAEAAVWGVSPDEIGLAQFEPLSLLGAPRKAA